MINPEDCMPGKIIRVPNTNPAEELAKAHWEYVGEVIGKNCDLNEPEMLDYIDNIKFHYTTAFIHGYKHGKADGDCEYNSKVNVWLELMKHIDEVGPKLSKYFNMENVRALAGVPIVTCECDGDCTCGGGCQDNKKEAPEFNAWRDPETGKPRKVMRMKYPEDFHQPPYPGPLKGCLHINCNCHQPPLTGPAKDKELREGKDIDPFYPGMHD